MIPPSSLPFRGSAHRDIFLWLRFNQFFLVPSLFPATFDILNVLFSPRFGLSPCFSDQILPVDLLLGPRTDFPAFTMSERLERSPLACCIPGLHAETQVVFCRDQYSSFPTYRVLGQFLPCSSVTSVLKYAPRCCFSPQLLVRCILFCRTLSSVVFFETFLFSFFFSSTPTLEYHSPSRFFSCLLSPLVLRHATYFGDLANLPSTLVCPPA